jgi:hypothetical protein
MSTAPDILLFIAAALVIMLILLLGWGIAIAVTAAYAYASNRPIRPAIQALLDEW